MVSGVRHARQEPQVGPLQSAGLRGSAKDPSAFERFLFLQAAAGNSAVTRLLNRQPVPAPPTTAPLKRFDFPVGFFFGPHFDMTYTPVGPLPAVGKATVTLNVHVKFKDFDR